MSKISHSRKPCMISTYQVAKGYKGAEIAMKEAIHVLGMTTTRLPYTNYYPTVRNAEL